MRTQTTICSLASLVNFTSRSSRYRHLARSIGMRIAQWSPSRNRSQSKRQRYGNHRWHRHHHAPVAQMFRRIRGGGACVVGRVQFEHKMGLLDAGTHALTPSEQVPRDKMNCAFVAWCRGGFIGIQQPPLPCVHLGSRVVYLEQVSMMVWWRVALAHPYSRKVSKVVPNESTAIGTIRILGTSSHRQGCHS